jgi:hypothetical protein
MWMRGYQRAKTTNPNRLQRWYPLHLTPCSASTESPIETRKMNGICPNCKTPLADDPKCGSDPRSGNVEICYTCGLTQSKHPPTADKSSTDTVDKIKAARKILFQKLGQPPEADDIADRMAWAQWRRMQRGEQLCKYTPSTSTPTPSHPNDMQNQDTTKPAADSDQTTDRVGVGRCDLLASEYQPETWAMLKDTIYAARDALRAGLENTEEYLTWHDANYGRTARLNRWNAERLEREIREMKEALEKLKQPDGSFLG